MAERASPRLHAEADAILAEVARRGDQPLDIAGASLALAAYDRPRVPLARYRRHLDELAEDAAAEAGGRRRAQGRVAVLGRVIAGRHGYAGDDLSYDDLQNANLIRVIDRRRGLPVALGILYIHVARAIGWAAEGLGFPNHFLVRVDAAGERAIIDPFAGGARRDPPELRQLVERMSGGRETLEPAHYAPVADREVLLRLQNNIKLRLIRQSRIEDALAVIERMLRFAPDRAALWREAAMVHQHLGNVRAAVLCLETCLDAGGLDAGARHDAAQRLQALKRRLN